MVPVAVERWDLALRRQLGLGRLLPLGRPADGLWLAERAAVPVLERAAESVTGVRLGTVRLGPDPAEPAGEPAVPPPPSALPPGPLRIAADCAVDLSTTAGAPLTDTADRLREALAEAASGRLGLPLVAVDLHVTGLLGEESPPDEGAGTSPTRRPELDRPHETAALPGWGELAEVVARAASATPGAVRAWPAPPLPHPSWLAASRPSTSPSAPEEAADAGAGGGADSPDGHRPPAHLLLHLTVTAERRVSDVAREVREAVRSSLAGQAAPRTLAVLVTAVTAV